MARRKLAFLDILEGQLRKQEGAHKSGKSSFSLLCIINMILNIINSFEPF